MSSPPKLGRSEEFIQEKEVMNFLEMSEFNRKYFGNPKPFEMLEYSGKFETDKIGELDRNIAGILSEKSRISAVELSKKINSAISLNNAQLLGINAEAIAQTILEALQYARNTNHASH